MSEEEKHIIGIDGSKEWRKNGLLHRDNGPAIEGNCYRCWFKNGERHREDGPAVEWINNSVVIEEWWLNGKRHNNSGPAILLRNGHKAWLINGKYHREDGPAIDGLDGTHYFLDNKEYTEEKYNRLVKLLFLI